MPYIWDERYNQETFLFGTEPNDFLREEAQRIPGLGDGEGRNGVWLAEQGYAVTAVHLSRVGLAKTQKLAARRGVEIETIFADLADFPIEPDTWCGIVSIFCHTPEQIRVPLHRRVVDGLSAGGIFILEGYHPDQIEKETGGPSDPDLLITATTIEKELRGLEIILAHDIEREVIEAASHTGQAAVTLLLAMHP